MPVVPRIAAGNSTIFGFPPTLLTKLRYVDTYALISTAGSLSKQTFYVNSIYDPDNSGVGHQPLYHDTYTSIYDQYAVVNTKMIIQYQSLAASTSMVIGAVIDDDNTSSTTPTTLMEQNLGKHLLLPPLYGSLSNRTISMLWDCKKHLGIDPFTSQTYKTAVGNNPTEAAALVIWSVPADGASIATTQVQVTMEFTVLFTELKTPTGS
jgi:hypothetical protein